MAISLYEGGVVSYLQTLEAVAGFLDKSLAHFREHGVDPEAVVDTALFVDMRPFRFQIVSVVHHSVGAVEAMRGGVFGPPTDRTPYDYAGLQGIVAGARDALGKLTPAEVDSREGAEVVFQVGDIRREFTAEGFLLSFSLPNFHFHATTAYDILRANGAPIGKRDYMGRLRLKD